MRKRTVIFDLDGTLADSIGFHFKIHKQVFLEVGIKLSWRYFFIECNGTEPHEFYKKIISDAKREPELIDIVWEKMVSEKRQKGLRSIKVFPGVKNMLKVLKSMGLEMIVASSSHKDYILTVLKNNKISDYFDSIVGSDKFKRSKPDPGIFLKAWKNSMVEKEYCVIIEDSPNGVVAARNAGIDVICLTTTTNIEDIPAYAILAEDHSEIPGLVRKM
ncbi:MAG: HAD family hydrolase [Candidatus Woesearchaeota archaeon]